MLFNGLFLITRLEEEDEPILGAWMETIMSPTDSKDSRPPPSLPPRLDGESVAGKRSRKASAGDGHALAPDKREDSVSVNIPRTVTLPLGMLVTWSF